MMPIFFNASSHLWIVYLLFINGFLLSLILSFNSTRYADLTQSLEARTLAAFFLSLIINGFLLLGLDLLGLAFVYAKLLLLAISVLLGFAVLTRVYKQKGISSFSFEYSKLRLVLYALVFLALFYNGGLIEQPSDAWWHMSYAKKLSLANSFSVDAAHLNGVHARYYPLLWHGNLALLTSASDISLPVFWNSFTAWGAVIKVMSFYLFALSLTRSMMAATLSSVLFVLLPGMGVSYLRVSAWPSHIAYTAFFTLWYVGFKFLDSLQGNYLNEIRRQIPIVLVLFALVSIIFLLHQVELVWFFAAALAYILGLCVVDILVPGNALQIEAQNRISKISMGAVLISAIGFGVWHFTNNFENVASSYDLIISNVYPIALLSFFLATFLRRFSGNIKHRSTCEIFLLAVFGLTQVFLLDGRQFISLFSPELAYQVAAYREFPVAVVGVFGQDLSLPGWHLQLRSGLLYSGVLSIPVAIGMAFWRPSRATVFLAATAIVSFLFLVSPYLHDWLQQLLNYNSIYRISILIFHPIVFGLLFYLCWQELTDSADNA